MRTATQMFGKVKPMTAKDLIKILRKVPEDTRIQVPSHCDDGFYTISSDGVSFDDEKVLIGI